MGPQMSASEYYEHGLVLKSVQMFHRAIDDFRKAALDPRYMGKAHLQIALCLKSIGRHGEAVMAIRQALAARTFSPLEERHILYHLGRTLESLRRYDESVEVYGWIRKDDPNFRDVTRRIAQLRSGEHESAPLSQGQWQTWMEEALMRGHQLKPHVDSLLEQTGQWLSRQAKSLKGHYLFTRITTGRSNPVMRGPQGVRIPDSLGQLPSRVPQSERRRHLRIPVSLRSHFSAKGRMASGEGELRDLSPWGCRVTSSMTVPIGDDLQCCIYPKDEANPFIVDGATVRWITSQGFGLAFTSVRPGVQRQIAQLCRSQMT